MGNRQDRRFAAKLAKQAGRKGTSPAERRIWEAAADHLTSAGGMDGELAPETLEMADFDDAWRRCEAGLRDVLAEEFESFRIEVYATAAWTAVSTSRDASAADAGAQVMLVPIVGAASDVSSFVAEAGALRGLAASFRDFGVVPEDTLFEVLPIVLAPEAVDLSTVGPGLVARLNRRLIEALATARTAGRVGSLGDVDLPILDPDACEGSVSGFLLGIEVAPLDAPNGVSDTEDDAHLAATAAYDSWFDNYAADLPLTLGQPVAWFEAAPTMAWIGLREDISSAASDAGLSEPISEVHACLYPDEGDALVVPFVGGRPLGPFTVRRNLAVADPDGLADLIEDQCGELTIHPTRAGVLARLR